MFGCARHRGGDRPPAESTVLRATALHAESAHGGSIQRPACAPRLRDEARVRLNRMYPPRWCSTIDAPARWETFAGRCPWLEPVRHRSFRLRTRRSPPGLTPRFAGAASLGSGSQGTGVCPKPPESGSHAGRETARLQHCAAGHGAVRDPLEKSMPAHIAGVRDRSRFYTASGAARRTTPSTRWVIGSQY